MKTGKNTSWRFYDADLIARRSTGFRARSPRRSSLKARFCSAATRLANPLVDLLFDVLFWLLREKDDNAGIAGSTSSEHAQAVSLSSYAGGNRG
jgi:hypothetical protein